MTATTTTYSADEVTVGLGPILVDGYGDGEFVRIEHNQPTFGLKVGTDGKGTRFKFLDRSAKITITVMQSSSANDALSTLHEGDRSAPNGAGIVPLYIRDGSGRALYTAAEAWISEPPKPAFGREPGAREWVVECTELERFDGGN